MDPVEPIRLMGSLSQEGALIKFLQFLGVLQEKEEKPPAASSLLKNIVAKIPGLPLSTKFSHEVRLLQILHQTKSDLEGLLQKIEKEKGETELSKMSEKEGAIRTKKTAAPLKQGAENQPREARVFSLAEQSEKKAMQILAPKKEARPNLPKELELSQPKKLPSGPSQAAEKNETSTLPSEEARLRSALRGLLSSVDPRMFEKTPTPELLRAIKPLLEHLIVVVETQENMSKPSEKLTRLIRSLKETPSFFKKLESLSLYQPETSASAPKKSIHAAPSEISSRKEEGFFSKPALKQPLVASSTSSSISSQPLQNPLKAPPESALLQKAPLEEKEILPQKTQEVPPFAAPYPHHKLEPRPREKEKKRKKSFWEREEEDPEEEKQDRS